MLFFFGELTPGCTSALQRCSKTEDISTPTRAITMFLTDGADVAT